MGAPSTIEQPDPVRATSTFSGELRELVRLGVPVVVSFVGSQALGLVDTAMLGRVDATSLAAVAIGNGIYFTIGLVGVGIVQGMDPLVSQALGAGDRSKARAIFWQTMRIALLISVPAMLIILLLGACIGWAGIDPQTSHYVWRYVLGRVLNIVPFLVYTAGRCYLQAIGKPSAAIWAFVWTNVANVIGNVLFIYGDDGLVRMGLPAIGLPALGVFGSGLASTLASIVTLVSIHRAVLRHGGAAVAEDLRSDWKTMRAVFHVGVPVALQLLGEVGGFALCGILAGKLGPTAAAGHQVALSLASSAFVFALGLSQATSVRVGLAVGRRDTPAARRAGFAGLTGGVFAATTAAIVFTFAPHLCARLLSDKPDVIEAAVPLIRIAAVFQLADATQAIATGALRGAGDTRYSQAVTMVGFYVIGLPLAMILAFHLKLGAIGIWWGLSTALFVVAITLLIRFFRLSKNEIRPL